MANLPPQRQSNRFLQLFERTFSEEAVIRELCKQRVRLAAKRNDTLFFHRISKGTGRFNDVVTKRNPIEAIFPPRRRWHRHRPRNRGNKSANELNLDGLFRTVMALRASTPNEPWVFALNERVADIRKRVFANEAFTFAPPRIVPIKKAPKENKYRPLAVLSPDDKIVDSLTARYFRNVADVALRSSCIAFRCRKGRRLPPTIHSALKKVCDVNRLYRKRGCYVAECDIKGFFDCVSHEIAMNSLNELISDAKRRTPNLVVHPRATEIFSAYLSAYSFPKNVLAGRTKYLRSKDPRGEFSWPRLELEKLHGSTNLEGIGVPQGGALSCLVANAVLHAADKSLERLKRKLGKSFTYLRYCDDMILIAREKKVCDAAFSEYIDAVSKRLLPVHPAKKQTTYSKLFWKGKSNSPYLWARPRNGKGLPWIQFVGYQIRYDGLVRVRLKSMKKHMRKLTEAADGMLAELNPGRRNGNIIPPFAPGLRKTNRQIIHRFRQRLISMAVGRLRLGQRRKEPMPMCWANGFRGLMGRRIVESSLKTLDCHRERQIQRIARRLRGRRNERRASSDVTKEVYRFYGAPFSYWAQFSYAQQGQ